MKPIVSILIPAFNAEEWIADSLKSALNQTWENKEIIVVDDGSTDKTVDIVRQFATAGVTVVTQKNQGAAAARNRAFSLSRGDYIQWLDADDLLAPNKIQAQLETLDRSSTPRTLLSSPWGRFIYRYHRAEFIPTALWADLSPIEWLVRKMEQNLHMQTATWLVSRELTEAAGAWDTQLLGDDDGEYFCRVILQSDQIKFAPDAKVFYRMPGVNNLSYIGRSNRKMDAQFRSMQLHVGYLRKVEDSLRVRMACVNYLQTWLIYFHPDRPDIIDRARELADELGGELELPKLSWKYAWIKLLFGWTLARRAQVFLLTVRWSVVRCWDKALFRAGSYFRSSRQTLASR